MEESLKRTQKEKTKQRIWKVEEETGRSLREDSGMLVMLCGVAKKRPGHIQVVVSH